MKYYYNLDVTDNGDFEFERYDKTTCISEVWYFNDNYCMNPAKPTLDEIKLIDMAFSHVISIASVWSEFSDFRFNYYLK